MKRKNPVKHTKRQRKSKHFGSKIFLILIILLMVTTTILILSENEFFKNRETTYIELRDECSLLFNNLIHSIKTEGNCESLCNLECERKDLEFEKIEFSLNETSCNNCDCYCN